MKNNKKKTHTSKYSKTIIVLCIVSVWIYVITNIIASIAGAIISDALTTCFFTFFGIEVLALASIKKTKAKNGKYDGSTLQENIDRINEENDDNIDSLKREIEEAITAESEEE